RGPPPPPPPPPRPPTPTVIAMRDVVAIVLCGGASRRMGQSKADLPFGDETLLERATRQLLDAFEHVVVAAAPGQPLPHLDAGRARIVRDASAYLGPLHGFSTALDALAASAEFAYLAAVDAPGFTPDWPRLLRGRIGDADAAAAKIGGRVQPFAALYRVGPAREAVASLHAQGSRQLVSLLDRLAVQWLREDELATVDPSGDLFRDLDSPEDYRRALDRMERESSRFEKG
ncbi:molybdenum cofactor guanylyltransferase, partial [Paludisphaera sp.]|uniref:molybdenum cofactor guanylyltransferase n=1 Tax=Paludisphaera sp. TaxID=2017432 RepID=UPI00301C5A30